MKADRLRSELGRRRGHEAGRRVRSRAYQNATFNLAPGVQGAHGWHSNAFNPETGLVYIATQEAYFNMGRLPNYKRSLTGYNVGINMLAPPPPGAKSGFIGFLQAWDPVAGKTVWKSEPNQGPTGGVVATTSGLLFQGNGNGQAAGGAATPTATNALPAGPNAKPELRAFDAKTGEKLWSFGTQTGIVAAPITYELEGQQYVAVSVGGAVPVGTTTRRTTRLLVFSRWQATLPPSVSTPRPLNPPANSASAEVVEIGQQRYAQYCSQCHGDNGQTRGANFPNLTRTPLLHAQEAFDSVVLTGVLAERGMASFADALKAEDTQALRAYLVKRANDLKNAPARGPRQAPADTSGNQHQQPGQ
jgi:mono/diheme cytochrome c family protein